MPTSEQSQWWLRIEGVNHNQFIFDTTDLSTIRGGGLLLLHAIDKVQELLEENPACTSIEAISTGASSGLFRFYTNDKDTAKQVTKELRTGLANHPNFKHISFVIALLPCSTLFPQDRETLIALNRHQQMIMPSLQMPSESGATEVCALDRVRPSAEKSIYKGDEKYFVSRSVFQRHEYGRKEKQGFYQKELVKFLKGTNNSCNETVNTVVSLLKNNFKFAPDFHNIADDTSKGSLNGKMAVLYADGNKFGEHQQSSTPNGLQKWDDYIKNKRRELLAYLLQPFLDLEYASSDTFIRFETLLWGGDELMFVIPAWKGLEFIQNFIQHTTNWHFDNKPLTHSIGMVFCHNNAPILRIKALAQALSEQAKEDSERKYSALHYSVLESFDHTGNDWNDYLQHTYAGKLKAQDRLLCAGDFDKTLDCLQIMRNNLPRGRLYDYLGALLELPTRAYPKESSEDAFRRLTHDLDENIIPSSVQNKISWWVHLAELWDYLPEKPENI